MGWTPGSWFSRAAEPDYETVLSQLESSIKARESHLLSIKLRERRANALFVTYGLAAYLLYALLWYFSFRATPDPLDKALVLAPVVGGPIVIIFIRRILAFWFHRKQDAEETTLRALKKSQREKVEELKKKTGYYSTRNLLEKYDEAIKKNTEARKPPNAVPARHLTPSAPSTPSQRQSPRSASNPASPQTPSNAMNFPPPNSLPLLPPAPSTPVPRTLFDKLADALLGISGDDGPNSKYALICAQCFAHNGLVLKDEFDTIQYRCPRCGYFNPSRNPSLQSGARGSRPTSMIDPESSRNGSGHHRRVQSMHHVSPNSILDQDPETEQPVNDEGGMDSSEVETTLIPDVVASRGGRQRVGRKDDDMDTD